MRHTFVEGIKIVHKHSSSGKVGAVRASGKACVESLSDAKSVVVRSRCHCFICEWASAPVSEKRLMHALPGRPQRPP